MTLYSVALGYMLRYDNCIMELMLLSLNIIFFGMEMKYILCKELILNIAEVGSIEIESFFAIMFILGGVYGSGIYGMTLG